VAPCCTHVCLARHRGDVDKRRSIKRGATNSKNRNRTGIRRYFENQQEGRAPTNTPQERTIDPQQVVPSTGDKKSEWNSHKGEDEGTEFWSPLSGYRIKITDSLLVIFTFGLFMATLYLWRATMRLVTDAEKTAERQLRAYMTVEPGGFIAWSAGVQGRAAINAKNVGSTPAYDVTVAR
jgi:hypothetical protein